MNEAIAIILIGVGIINLIFAIWVLPDLIRGMSLPPMPPLPPLRKGGDLE